MTITEEEQVSQTPLDVTGPPQGLAYRLRAALLPALTWEALAWFGLLIAALITRLWNLGARVMSHDESMHVYYSWLLSQGGEYRHNPMMHGPSLYELTGLIQSIFPVTDFTARLVPALIGMVLVIVIPLLLKPWLGRWGALAASVFFLVSPYILYFSRYNRHDIYEITWALLATAAILNYLRERPGASPVPSAQPLPVEAVDGGETPPPAAGETAQPAPADQADNWLLILAGAVGLMFSTMETAFFYLAIFASFLLFRLLWLHGLHWKRIQRAAEFDLLVVLVTLGAFFSSPIALLVLNPIWTAITGSAFVPLETLAVFGIEWSQGPYGTHLWGLMIVFWWVASIIGILWDWRRWSKLALVFLVVTITMFTTFYSNWSGIGTGFVGSLGYWLSQHDVQRGNQPWYYYFIVFPIYEYLAIAGSLAAAVFFGLRWRLFNAHVRGFILYVAWWAVWIFTGLSIAGEKMPWLSTHITTPLILLSGWFAGQLLERLWSKDAEGQPLLRPEAALGLMALTILAVLSARTAYYANYVNYDSVEEFIDYAHGAPGVRWLADDVETISAALQQGDAMPVAFDSENAWPLTWYLRSRAGFFGEQPNRATLLSTPVVIAGQANWEKVERYLGADYNRYEMNRIWWPMEDYKDLTWERIRGALVDPEMRRAVWNILWARDYSLYSDLTGQVLDAPRQWPLQVRMRVYIRKDAASLAPNLRVAQSQIADITVLPDPYIAKQVILFPMRLIQPGDFNLPRSLALAPDGSVYVADTGNSRIVHLDAQGKVLGSWGGRTPEGQNPPAAGTFNEPWGVAVDAGGNVYVTDTWNHRVQKFDAQGSFLLEWGTGGVSAEGSDRFWGPRGIAVGPNGNVYVTDTGNRRVVVFDAQGAFQFEFAADNSAQLNEPVGITFDAEDRALVVDTWNMRVAIFDAQGQYVKSWPVSSWNGTSIDEKPFIAIDSLNRVYLSDPEAGRVLVFNDGGVPLAAFGQPGSLGNQFELPTGLAADGQGRIWVVDAGNNRLSVYPELEK